MSQPTYNKDTPKGLLPANQYYLVGNYLCSCIFFITFIILDKHFLDRAQLLMQKLFKQGYAAPRLVIARKILPSSSQSDWPLRNIHISNDNGSLTFYVDVFLPLSLPRLLPDFAVYMSNTEGVTVSVDVFLPLSLPRLLPDFAVYIYE